MSARMTVRLWVVALGVACLTACYQPKPAVHAVLQIAADGAYTFQGGLLRERIWPPRWRRLTHVSRR